MEVPSDEVIFVAVNPGWIKTEMVIFSFLCKSECVRKMLLFRADQRPQPVWNSARNG